MNRGQRTQSLGKVGERHKVWDSGTQLDLLSQRESKKVVNLPSNKNIPTANLPHEEIENRYGFDLPPASDRVTIMLS